jgi:hypothetical protein
MARINQNQKNKRAAIDSAMASDVKKQKIEDNGTDPHEAVQKMRPA